MAPLLESFKEPGYYLDGWADLVEDRGDKSSEVRQDFFKRLKARNMPDVNLSQATPSLNNEKRPYSIAATHPGARTLIYIDARGPDLFVSWKTFIKPVLNGQTIASIALVAGFIALIAWTKLGFIFALFTFVMLALLITGAVATIGRFTKGSSVAYFFIEPTLFDADDIAAMGLAVHKTLLHALNNAGIKEDALRLKRNFSAGRRGESI